jgi:DNA-binding transcriptional LysR family regulator
MQMRQLEAFHAIVVTGTVTKAAQKLCISQPSVSRLITDLEADLGFSLFQRKKGRIQPNQDGYDFFKQLTTVYSGIEKLHSFAHAIRTERSGHLRISVSSALSISILPKVVMQFQKRWPQVHITLNICSPITILDELQEHETDIGFLNKMVDMPGLVQEPLIEATFICALPPGHRLVDEPEIDVHMLEGENLIMLESEGGLTWLPHLEMLKNSGITYKTTLSTQRSLTAYGLVLEGAGIGILEPFSAHHWQSLGVIIKPFKPRMSYPFVIAFSEARPHSELVDNFIAQVRQHLIDQPLLFQQFCDQ